MTSTIATTNGSDTANSSAGLRDLLPTLAPTEQRALTALGDRLAREGRFVDAAAVFELLLAVADDNAFYHRAFGVCCERADRLDEARTALDRAIQMDPNDAFARTARASVRMRGGDRSGALEDLKLAKAAGANGDTKVAQRIDLMLTAALL